MAADSPHPAARSVTPPPPSWLLPPTRPNDLLPAARLSLGRLIDVGEVRLVLSDRGDVFAVARRAGR